MRFVLAGLLACVSCARPPATPAALRAERARPSGAVLLAHPGAAPALTVAGAPRELVRGRVRWRLDDDAGATRLREVASEPAHIAVAIPPWLGEGIALFGDRGVAIASPAGMRPIVRASLTGPSVGAHELWARLRAGGDWVRIDVGSAEATVEAPPLAAPVAIPLPYAGRAATAGPEFVTPSAGVALVDLLGPVSTRDGGATWSPIEGVRAAFPAALPTRVVRDRAGVALATEDRAAAVSPTGVLGSAFDLGKGPPSIPEVASVRVEALAPFGVPTGDGELLVADGPRLARVQLDPVRVVRVSRDDTLTRCELGPAHGALATAVCMRHEEGTSFGARIVAGTVVDAATGPRLVVERSFPAATTWAISSSGGVVVAASCQGSAEGGSDLLGATRLCTRDDEGHWTDLVLAGARRSVLPRSDGAVIVLRDDGAGGELVMWPRGATPAATPARLPLEPAKPPWDVLAIDEPSPGRVIVWRRRGAELRAIHVAARAGRLERSFESAPAILDLDAVVGVHGDHALTITARKSGEARDLDAALTNDGGRTWSTDAFPAGVKPLEPRSDKVECGPAGCRAFGWSRVGWEPTVAAYDRVVDIEAAPPIAPAPPAPKRSTLLTASCVRVAPKKTLEASKAHGLGSAALLGLPAPKGAPGQVVAITPFAPGTVRGAVWSVGPASGPWNGNARTVVRFTSDLDPPGVVHESAPFPSPYPDRIAAGVSASAFALAPGRIALAIWTDGRTEVFRVEAAAAPERLRVPPVAIGRVVSARELGTTLLLTGVGRPADAPPLAGAAAFSAFFDTNPFVALVDASGAHASFLAPGATIDETRLGALVDSARGAFAVATLGSLPTWSGGTLHVLPLNADARPSAGFSSFAGVSSDVARPTACTQASSGWERVESSYRALSLSIDKGPPSVVQGSAVVRTRVSSAGVCLDRFTFVRADALFQLDAPARRALHLALDEGGATAHRDELSCSFAWE